MIKKKYPPASYSSLSFFTTTCSRLAFVMTTFIKSKRYAVAAPNHTQQMDLLVQQQQRQQQDPEKEVVEQSEQQLQA